MSFGCGADLVGIPHKIFAGILPYFKEILVNMTAEDVPQTSGRGF